MKKADLYSLEKGDVIVASCIWEWLWIAPGPNDRRADVLKKRAFVVLEKVDMKRYMTDRGMLFFYYNADIVVL